MAAPCQARQPASWESPPDLLVAFAIDLVIICDLLMSFNLIAPLHGYQLLLTLEPYISA